MNSWSMIQRIGVKMKDRKGKSRTKLALVWRSMISRCHNANDKGYARYGARGIKVCDEWRDDFDIFESWALKAGYTEGLTIDRVNNDGNYEPSNCEFISRGRNASKTSRNVILSAFGENKITYDWLRDPRCKVKAETLRDRLRRGWPPESALVTPPQRIKRKTWAHLANGNRRVFLTAFGETKYLTEWVRDVRCKVKIHLLRARLDKLKWHPEDAISIPPNKLFTGRSKTALQSQILQGV